MKLAKYCLTLLLIITLTVAPNTPFIVAQPVFAEDLPTPPATPAAPSTPAPANTTAPQPSQPPTQSDAPQNTPNPAAATPASAKTAAPAATVAPRESKAPATPRPTMTPQSAHKPVSSEADEDDDEPAASTLPQYGTTTGAKQGDRATGDSTVQTGDANVNGSVVNGVNNNIVSGSGSGNGSSAAANNGNGSDSTNNANTNNSTSSDQELQNAADVSNNVQLGAVSGDNSASRNTGDGTVLTGDANVGVTVINSANNNISGLAVNQYDVNNNQTGDIVLGSTAPSLSCGTSENVCQNGVLGSSAKNTGNGSDSTNNASSNNNSNSVKNLSNNADVVNDVAVDAVTGRNTANSNVGKGTVETGDANVLVTVLNFLNNNIVAGTVDVVNIFGDYVGNIVMPESSNNTSGVAGNSAAGNNASGNQVSANRGNGDSSQNTASSSANSSSTTNQANVADIDNNIDVTANTGNNRTDSNNGNNNVDTGSTNVNAKIYNVANVNSKDGGYIVLVNDNGKWRGTIYGADTKSAGSEGIQFTVQPDGTVVASNDGNGAASTNNAQANSTTNSETNQSNTAKLENNVKINADTGNNSASRNVGGGEVSTGNVNVGASIMNFVNNNFVGKTFKVVLVNVLGKWTGNVVKPGTPSPAQQETKATAAATTTPAPTAKPSATVNPTATPASANTVASNKGVVLGKMTSLDGKNGSNKKPAQIELSNGMKYYVGDTLTVPENEPIVAAAVGTQPAKNAMNNWVYLLIVFPIMTLIAVRKIRNN